MVCNSIKTKLGSLYRTQTATKTLFKLQNITMQRSQRRLRSRAAIEKVDIRYIDTSQGWRQVNRLRKGSASGCGLRQTNLAHVADRTLVFVNTILDSYRLRNYRALSKKMKTKNMQRKKYLNSFLYAYFLFLLLFVKTYK